VHQDRLVSNLTPTRLPFHASLQTLTQRFSGHGADSVTASQRALATVSQQMQTQAATLAYLDTFMVLMFACLVAVVLTIFLKNIKLGEAHAH
jgi:DHA2 family multidrug resistance protein